MSSGTSTEDDRGSWQNKYQSLSRKPLSSFSFDATLEPLVTSLLFFSSCVIVRSTLCGRVSRDVTAPSAFECGQLNETTAIWTRGIRQINTAFIQVLGKGGPQIVTASVCLLQLGEQVFHVTLSAANVSKGRIEVHKASYYLGVHICALQFIFVP